MHKNVKWEMCVPGRLLFRLFSPQFPSARCASSPPANTKKENKKEKGNKNDDKKRERMQLIRM